MSDKEQGFFINFTPRTLEEFKIAYERAVENDQESFVFHTKTIVTRFASYVIEYVEDQMQEQRNDDDATPFPPLPLN